MMRVTLAWLVLALAAATAQAAVTVTAGFGGVCGYGYPVPVHVSGLRGSEPPTVRLLADGRELSRATTDDSRADVWLYLPQPSTDCDDVNYESLVVEVSTPAEPLPLRRVVTLVARRWQIGWVKRSGSMLYDTVATQRDLPSSPLWRDKPSGRRPNWLHLATELPDAVAGYRTLNTLVLEDSPTNWSEPVAAALHAWVLRGGNLVGIGSEGAWYGDLHPVSATGDEVVNHWAARSNAADARALASVYADPPEAFPSLPLTHRLVSTGARVVAEGHNGPLVVSQEVGAGRVVWLAAPWAAPDLWLDALGVLRPQHNAERHPDWFNQCGALLPGARPPRTRAILGFVLAYLLAWLWLQWRVGRRARRPELVWLATPGLVLGFCLVSNAVGAWYWGRTLSAQTVTQVTVGAGQQHAWASSETALLSPDRRRVDVKLPANSLLAQDSSASGHGRRHGSSPPLSALLPDRALTQAGPTTTFSQTLLHKWEPRRLAYEYPTDLGGTVEVRVRPSDGRQQLVDLSGDDKIAPGLMGRMRVHASDVPKRIVDVTITNKLDCRLEEVTVQCLGALRELQSLGPGESVTRQINASADYGSDGAGHTELCLPGLPPLSFRPRADYTWRSVVVRGWTVRPTCPFELDRTARAREVRQLAVLAALPFGADGLSRLPCRKHDQTMVGLRALYSLDQPLGNQRDWQFEVSSEKALDNFEFWDPRHGHWSRPSDARRADLPARDYLAGATALLVRDPKAGEVDHLTVSARREH